MYNGFLEVYGQALWLSNNFFSPPIFTPQGGENTLQNCFIQGKMLKELIARQNLIMMAC